MTRQQYTIEELKMMLAAKAGDVAYRYAPAVQGSFEDKGLYWTLNPGRADKSVGSFCIHVAGPKAGRWNDYATGEHGDLIDLIRLRLGCSMTDAIREARHFLGLSYDAPGDERRRKAEIERSHQLRAQAEEKQAEIAQKRRAAAMRLWLSAEERIRATPVDDYLQGRGIDLAQLGRQPRAIRYARECYYKHTDVKTGEVIEGRFPAMVSIITNRHGDTIACHRTYLGRRPDGTWGKADLPEAKKVLGDYLGGWINLWRGTGPRGGVAQSLSKAAPGERLYIAEGIEDALSGAMLLPDSRFAAAISISNLARVDLPPNVSEVVLIADQDEGPQAQALLQRAIDTHIRAGRKVRVWKNRHGGKDLNDALRAMRESEGRHDQRQGGAA